MYRLSQLQEPTPQLQGQNQYLLRFKVLEEEGETQQLVRVPMLHVERLERLVGTLHLF